MTKVREPSIITPQGVSGLNLELRLVEPIKAVATPEEKDAFALRGAREYGFLYVCVATSPDGLSVVTNYYAQRSRCK